MKNSSGLSAFVAGLCFSALWLRWTRSRRAFQVGTPHVDGISPRDKGNCMKRQGSVFRCPTCLSNWWNLDLEGVSCMAQQNAVLHLGLRLRTNRHRKPIRLRAQLVSTPFPRQWSRSMFTIEMWWAACEMPKSALPRTVLKFEFLPFYQFTYPLHGWYGLIAEKENATKGSALHRSILILFD